MPYEGPTQKSKPGSLLELINHIERQLRPALETIAEDVGDRVTSLTRDNTPIRDAPSLYQHLFGSNASPFREHLRELIFKRRVTVFVTTQGDLVFETGAQTDVEYAGYVEDGTGLWGPRHAPYLIRPKKPGGTLHWVDRFGRHIFAKQVMHPGSPGQHMFAIGVHATEREFDRIAERGLQEFKRRCEAFYNGAK